MCCTGDTAIDTLSASYPDVSLSIKMYAQRKAGRRLYPSHGPLRLITCRSPLPCENEAPEEEADKEADKEADTL